MYGNAFWLIEAEVGSIKQWYLPSNIIPRLQLVDLAERLKPKGKWLDEFYLQTNKNKFAQTDEKTSSISRHYIMFPKGIGPIFVKISA